MEKYKWKIKRSKGQRTNANILFDRVQIEQKKVNKWINWLGRNNSSKMSNKIPEVMKDIEKDYKEPNYIDTFLERRKRKLDKL